MCTVMVVRSVYGDGGKASQNTSAVRTYKCVRTAAELTSVLVRTRADSRVLEVVQLGLTKSLSNSATNANVPTDGA